jgi:hypothetical protein
MASCWRALGQPSEANKMFMESLASIESARLSEEKKKCMCEEATKEFETPLSPKDDTLWVQYRQPPPLSHGPAEDNDTLSAAVRVQNDDQFGRHLVAQRDINTGIIRYGILFLVQRVRYLRD